MAVRAKFTVQSVTETKWGTDKDGKKVLVYEVKMWPVTSGSPEDTAFWQATPAGEIRLSTVNKTAADQFESGDAFYVDFTPAD